jgi:hypothetical protein
MELWCHTETLDEKGVAMATKAAKGKKTAHKAAAKKAAAVATTKTSGKASGTGARQRLGEVKAAAKKKPRNPLGEVKK